jgi:hypothetical protein
MDATVSDRRALDPRKFDDPHVTLDGSPRARVALNELRTVWFNTGTLCNLTCRNCYIESSPKNDRLAYLTVAEVGTFLDEIATLALPTQEIGFTGGEPFMNLEIIEMLARTLERGFSALVLTNAMRPMMTHSTCMKPNEAREPGHARSRGSGGCHGKDLPSTSPAGPDGTNPKTPFAPVTAICSRARTSGSTRATPRRSCFSRRWTPRQTFRRSPSHAGGFSMSVPTP